MPSTVSAAIYVRVSTQDQSYEMQLTELRAFAQRMGWNAVEYAEKMSAIKTRPVLERMMSDARHRKFDVVLVWKLDRFARSLQQLLANITLLDSFGVRFVCLTQGIDTDKNNPASRMMLQIMGAVAEFERALIVERVRSGVAQAKKSGKHCGRKKEIWNRSEAVQLRKQGFSTRDISRRLGIPETSIRRALKAAPKV